MCWGSVHATRVDEFTVRVHSPSTRLYKNSKKIRWQGFLAKSCSVLGVVSLNWLSGECLARPAHFSDASAANVVTIFLKQFYPLTSCRYSARGHVSSSFYRSTAWNYNVTENCRKRTEKWMRPISTGNPVGVLVDERSPEGNLSYGRFKPIQTTK